MFFLVMHFIPSNMNNRYIDIIKKFRSSLEYMMFRCFNVSIFIKKERNFVCCIIGRMSSNRIVLTIYGSLSDLFPSKSIFYLIRFYMIVYFLIYFMLSKDYLIIVFACEYNYKSTYRKISKKELNS
jgi:hypothetical protein